MFSQLFDLCPHLRRDLLTLLFVYATIEQRGQPNHLLDGIDQLSRCIAMFE